MFFQEHSHPAGLYLKMKVLLRGDPEEKVLQNGNAY